MVRCMLCRKRVESLSTHGLCPECEAQFDFDQNEPYHPAEDEDTGKTLFKRILLTSACAIGLILFFWLAIPFLFSLFQISL